MMARICKSVLFLRLFAPSRPIMAPRAIASDTFQNFGRRSPAARASARVEVVHMALFIRKIQCVSAVVPVVWDALMVRVVDKSLMVSGNKIQRGFSTSSIIMQMDKRIIIDGASYHK